MLKIVRNIESCEALKIVINYKELRKIAKNCGLGLGAGRWGYGLYSSTICHRQSTNIHIIKVLFFSKKLKLFEKTAKFSQISPFSLKKFPIASSSPFFTNFPKVSLFINFKVSS